MTETTPTSADTSPDRSPSATHPEPPAWISLDVVLSKSLRTDLSTLVAEAEALEEQIHHFAVRSVRVVAQFDAAVLEADDAQDLGDEGVRLVEKHSGVSQLLDLVDTML